MNVSDLRSKDTKELGSELTALRREQFNLRLQLATGQSNKTHRLGEVKRDIARVKTVLSEKGRAK